MVTDGNGPRSGGVASWGERLTRISEEITDVKRVVVVVVILYHCMNIFPPTVPEVVEYPHDDVLDESPVRLVTHVRASLQHVERRVGRHLTHVPRYRHSRSTTTSYTMCHSG